MPTQNALTAQIATMTSDELCEVMRALMADFRPEADAVFDACMRAAQATMSSAAFLSLCAQLEAAA